MGRRSRDVSLFSNSSLYPLPIVVGFSAFYSSTSWPSHYVLRNNTTSGSTWLIQPCVVSLSKQTQSFVFSKLKAKYWSDRFYNWAKLNMGFWGAYSPLPPPYSLFKASRCFSRYEGMIEYEPTFPAPYKRKVAILKAQNKIADAVNDLNRYLNTFR